MAHSTKSTAKQMAVDKKFDLIAPLASAINQMSRVLVSSSYFTF